MATKLHLASDLHLEHGELTLPGGDILLLAGDICEAARLKPVTSELTNTVVRDQRLRYQDFWHNQVTKYRKVYMVMGNHEHYHGTYNRSKQQIESYVPECVTVLENSTVDLGEYLLVGATLWTDLNNGCPITEQQVRFSMNDYSQVRVNDRGTYSKLYPLYTRRVHLESRAYIKQVVEDNPDRKIIVLTHHAPSFRSVNAKYANDHYNNGAYASELCDLILDNPNIRYWFHGHMHDAADYQIGDCRVISNPRGYVGYENTFGYTPLEIDLV